MEMSFYLYDIIFLIIFALIGGVFLWKRKKNLHRELKVFVLYKTQVGVKFIDYIGKKYKKVLNVLKYFVIVVGYILMIGILYRLVEAVYAYIKYPIMTEIIKSPPVVLLIPYFPKIFGVSSFFPPFYFTYFIIAFIIVATVHEFAHGIFARYNKVRIKSTGVAFLGPLPVGAFVEQDDKDMIKKSKTAQLSILGAGVFANIIVAGIFLLIWWSLFSVAFTPVGATFSSYALGKVDVSSIENIGGIKVNSQTNQGLIDLINEGNFTTDLVIEIDGDSLTLTRIKTNDKNYFMNIDLLKMQLEQNASYVTLFQDLPAIHVGLKGTIIEIDSKEIKTYGDLSEIMIEYRPGDNVNIKTRYKDEILEYNLVLGEYSNKKGRGVLGITNNPNLLDIEKIRIDEQTANLFFRSTFTEYKTNNDFLVFLYYLVFWVFGINLVVALINMLPFLIFDGGRFFYLTVLGITKSEKVARGAYKWVGIIILLSLLLMMFTWFLRII